MRTAAGPVATYELDAVGAFGPLAVDGEQQYEFSITRTYSEVEHHIYMQAFTRSNYMIRLLSVEPESVIAQNIEASERHTTVTAIRYKEWWGDAPGAANDTLEIGGTNVINAATSPREKRVIGFHTFDRGSDGVTNVSEPEAFFFGLPFQSGADIFTAAAPPEGAVCLANAPRGDESSMQVINVPNLRSDGHRISVEFTDFVREGDPACGAAAAVATPTPEPAVQLPDTGTGTASDTGASMAVWLSIALGTGAAAFGAAGALRRRRS
jgi:hypothetical protein